MEMNYPIFTEDMKKTHKILIPNMAPVQFRILAAAMTYKGYDVELLGNCGSQGLRHELLRRRLPFSGGQLPQGPQPAAQGLPKGKLPPPGGEPEQHPLQQGLLSLRPADAAGAIGHIVAVFQLQLHVTPLPVHRRCRACRSRR